MRLFGLVQALRDIAVALRLNAQPQTIDPDYRRILEENTAAMRAAFDQNERAMALKAESDHRRDVFEAEQRAHMAECAYRYREMQAGQTPSGTPYRH